jgi:phosphatidylglycerol lysyltransferase
VIGFNTVAFLLGMLAFGALGLLWGAHHRPLLHLSAGSLQAWPWPCCWAWRPLWRCATTGGAGLALGPGRRWHLGLRLPPAGLALAQLAISAVELRPRAWRCGACCRRTRCRC